jgi:hypothetical protein
LDRHLNGLEFGCFRSRRVREKDKRLKVGKSINQKHPESVTAE